MYHLSITDAAEFYKSWGDNDDLGWAAAWLARAMPSPSSSSSATAKKKSFVAKAEAYSSAVGWEGGEQSWDEKTPGLNLLLFKLTGKEQHKTMVTKFLLKWLPGKRKSPSFFAPPPPSVPPRIRGQSTLFSAEPARVGCHTHPPCLC